MFALSNSGVGSSYSLTRSIELGRDALQVLDDLVVDLLRVDRHLLDLRAEQVAHEAAREARLAVDQRGRADEVRLPLDPLPLRR